MNCFIKILITVSIIIAATMVVLICNDKRPKCLQEQCETVIMILPMGDSVVPVPVAQCECIKYEMLDAAIYEAGK